MHIVYYEVFPQIRKKDRNTMCNTCNANVTSNCRRSYGCCNGCFCNNGSTFSQRVCRDCCGNIRVNQWGCGSCNCCGCNNGNAASNTSDNGYNGYGQSFTCVSFCGKGSNWSNFATASNNEYNGRNCESRSNGSNRSCSCGYGY